MNLYRPLLPLSGVELIEWLALRRVCGGGVAMVGARWCDLGRLVPSYLDDPLEDLHGAGLVALAGVDGWGLRRAAVTLAGRARFVELSAKRAAPIEPLAGRLPLGCGWSGQGFDQSLSEDWSSDRRLVGSGGMAS